MGERKSVFISYAREDAVSARKIADALQTLGRSVWLDENVEPGEDWESSITESLSSSSSVVLLVSGSSLTSQSTFYEAGLALEHARRNPGVKVLPVFLEPVNPGALPPPLRSLQFIDASKAGDRTSEEINRALGPARLDNAEGV